MDSHPTVALLAPVPEVFLPEGKHLCENPRRGKVAFGSRAWEVFRRLDALRGGLPVYTLIYASHAGAPRPVASWRGYYIGHVEGVNGAHPDGPKYRPRTAVEDREDEGWWAVFWEVTGLEPLSVPISIGELRGFGAKRNYAPFIPEGPVIIERP
ncbi:MAG: hypothetical protein QMD96_01915 [Anaerosomatales bacterium]|nr:hypothetical protein [Anaerosomatales bacterium]